MKQVTLTAYVLLGACILAVPGAAGAQETPVIVKGDLGREVDELLSRYVDWGFCGSVLIARDDQIVIRKGFGLADRAKGIPNTPDTLFEIASVAKNLTAAAILQLEETGTLSTDDSIVKWLPDVPDEHAVVTIGHLLSHSSGFPRMGPSGSGPDASAALEAFLSGGRVGEVGEKFEYWNGGYAILAMIVERASGRSLEAYCRAHLFGPAGMTSTGFCQETTHDDRLLAHGYHEDHDVGAASAHSFGWEYRGMGGVVTSVVDLYRWDQALRAGKVLRSTRKLETPVLSGYAGGAWVEPTSRGTTQLMLGGNVAGFNSAVWRMPEDRAAVVVLCNTSDNAMIVGMHLVRRLFDERGFLRPAPRPAELDAAALRVFCGTFRSQEGATIRIEPRGRALVVAGEGQPVVQLLVYGNATVPPNVQAAIDEAGRILDGVMDDDYGPFRAAMAQDIPADWPARFRSYWQERVGTGGAIESVEVVGARPTARSPSALNVLFRLHQADGASLVEILLDGGRMHVFNLDAQGPAVEARFVPTSPRKLDTYRIGPGALPTIEIDEEGMNLTISGSRGHPLSFERRVDRP